MAERCAEYKPKSNQYSQKADPRPVKDSKKASAVGAFATGLESVHVEQASSETTKRSCAMCKGPHKLQLCPDFNKLKVSERVMVIKKNGLCLGCLNWGHMKRECKNKQTCNVCKGTHPTMLHDPDYKPRIRNNDKDAKESKDSSKDSCKDSSKQDNKDSETVTARCTSASDAGDCSSLIVPVVLGHKGCNDSILTYALLDDQSDGCFYLEPVLERLNVQGEPHTLKLSTMTSTTIIECSRVTDLVVKGLYESHGYDLPPCYSRGVIPASHSQIPRPDQVKSWAHLEPIANKIAPVFGDVEIGLLIGLNCLEAIKPQEVVPGKDRDPYAVRTGLGWGVVGLRPPNSKPPDGHFVFRTRLSEVTPDAVNKMFDIEYCERNSEGQSLSVEDRRFLDKLKSEIRQCDDGHFELPLPFREENLKMPNNRSQALKRLNSLRSRMTKNPKFQDEYQEYMSSMIDKGYCERVPEDDAAPEGTVFYLSHHAVYHPRKKTLRIVFNASESYEGEVLNDHLLQGPDMLNNLVGVLQRFRKEPVALVCDIQSFFNQVKVKEEHRNFLRFLWYENGEVVEYRMTRHLFGARSSPGCATFALRATADKYESECGTEAADFVRNGFYCDDGTTSVVTTDSGKNLAVSSRKLCKKGEFPLRSYLSNDREVMEAVPLEARAKGAQEIDLLSEDLPTERTLGLQWSAQSDSFFFQSVFER